LIPTHEDAAENERLQAMVESNDGFVLAERDLQQRGPGEFLGTRQAGFALGLRMASLTDVKLIEKARIQAQSIFEKDPDLTQPEHALLAEALNTSGDAESAIIAYRQALDSCLIQDSAWRCRLTIGLGEAAMSSHQYETAVSAFNFRNMCQNQLFSSRTYWIGENSHCSVIVNSPND